MNVVWLRGTGKWVITGVVVVLSIGLALFLISRGKGKDAQLVFADAADRWAKRGIEARKDKIGSLEKDLTKNSPKIKKLTAEIDQIKGDLKKKHEKRDLSAEEIAKRFDDLSI